MIRTFGSRLRWFLHATAAFDRHTRLGRAWQPHTMHGMYVLPNQTARGLYRLRYDLMDNFGAARERVWLTTPDFIPDRQPSYVARRCPTRRRRAHGAEQERSPNRTVSRLRRLLADTAVGVRIFEHRSRMLYAKTAIVDNEWCTIGTANFDNLSFVVNDDLNLIAEDASFNAELAAQFESGLFPRSHGRILAASSVTCPGRRGDRLVAAALALGE